MKELIAFIVLVVGLFAIVAIGIWKDTSKTEKEILTEENARLHENLYREQTKRVNASEEIIKVYDKEIVDILLCCTCSRSCLGGVEPVPSEYPAIPGGRND